MCLVLLAALRRTHICYSIVYIGWWSVQDRGRWSGYSHGEHCGAGWWGRAPYWCSTSCHTIYTPSGNHVQCHIFKCVYTGVHRSPVDINCFPFFIDELSYNVLHQNIFSGSLYCSQWGINTTGQVSLFIHSFIHYLFFQGPVGRHGILQEGDEILEINNNVLVGLQHNEAIEVVKHTPNFVQVVVCSINKNGEETELNVTSEYWHVFTCIVWAY